MVKYEEYILANGLKVVLNPTKASSLVVVSVVYNVGSKHENPNQTGLAHFLEHLMFTGTALVPKIDTILQNAGASNNAFTSSDITSYYEVLPKENYELALCIEADRMQNLAFDKTAFDTQKEVVMEEFKQRYINQPYGDVMALLKDMVYINHPYRWSTIGLNLEHIQGFDIENTKKFYQQYYAPNNAVLSVSGSFNSSELKEKIQLYFGKISPKILPPFVIQKQEEQSKKRQQIVHRDVPLNAYYQAYKIPKNASQEYLYADLLTGILASDGTGILYKKLVMDDELCSDVGVFLSNEVEEGVMIVVAMLNQGVEMEKVAGIINEVLANLQNYITEEFLQREKLKCETSFMYAILKVESRAKILGSLAADNRTHDINDWLKDMQKVTCADVLGFAKKYLSIQKQNELLYFSKSN